MANISKDTNAVNANAHGGAPVDNWISQIKAGETVYDIATHHSVTFREGQGGATTVWNGLTDIEVVIPTITDIVQSPIEFAGTVGVSGEVEWNSTHTDGPKTGYLVFITADCTFADYACEACDMAIYDGSKWNVVSGENQVKIVAGTAEGIAEGNRTTIAVGSAKDVLVVEGKALALTLDYNDLNTNHLNVTKTTGENVIDVLFGDMKVAETYVKLSYEGDKEAMSIAKDTTIQTATALANGEVKLSGATGLVNGVNFGTFDAGTLPSFSKNVETSFDVTGGGLTKVEAGTDFVKNVTLGDVEFVPGTSSDTGAIHTLTSLEYKAGEKFLSNIHLTKKEEGETADLTIAGYVAPTVDGVKFIQAIEGVNSVVTKVTEGSFGLTDGSTKIATGFGTAVAGKDGDVLSDVTVSANNNVNAFTSASVNDHVLSFDTTAVANSVSVSYTSKSLNTTGFEYVSAKGTDTAFETSGFKKLADVEYTFGTGTDSTYTTSDAYVKLSTPKLNVETGSYTINNAGMKITVPAQTFVTGGETGTLPTWTGHDVSTTNITGTVETALTLKDVAIREVAAGVDSIPVAGGYTLTSADTAGDNTVLVGKAGDLEEYSATVTLAGYVTDVAIK